MLTEGAVFVAPMPNGVETLAIAIHGVTKYSEDENPTVIGTEWICYAQNRLFSLFEENSGAIHFIYMIGCYVTIPVCDEAIEELSKEHHQE